MTCNRALTAVIAGFIAMGIGVLGFVLGELGYGVVSTTFSVGVSIVGIFLGAGGSIKLLACRASFNRLLAGISHLESSGPGTRLDPWSADEFAQLAMAVNRLNSKLSESAIGRNFFSQILGAIEEGLFVIDSEGTIYLANTAAQKLVERDEDSLLGMNLWGILSFKSSDEGSCFTENEFGDSGSVEIESVVRPGFSRLLQIVWSSFEDFQSFADRQLWVFAISDVTEKRSLEFQLLQSSKIEAVGRLAGGIAHDFNNILGGINGVSETLKKRFVGDEQTTQRLDLITRCVERASGLTAKLLNFARPKSVFFEEISLSYLIGDVTAMLSETLSKSIRLTANIRAPLFKVRADASQITTVIVNLVLNAADALEGQGSIDIELTNLLPEEAFDASVALEKRHYVRISVRDSGPGISAELQAKIFDPFFSTKLVGKGTGLGLAMVYSIVQSHMGVITIDSEEGKGACFYIYLPALGVFEQIDLDRGMSGDLQRNDYESLRGKHVVLVDRDEVMCQATAELLRAYGLTVDVKADRSDFDLCGSSDEQRLDLAIVDISTPLEEGLAVFDAVRRVHSEIPVIFYSGNALGERVERLESDPKVAFVRKPFALNELFGRMGELLR